MELEEVQEELNAIKEALYDALQQYGTQDIVTRQEFQELKLDQEKRYQQITDVLLDVQSSVKSLVDTQTTLQNGLGQMFHKWDELAKQFKLQTTHARVYPESPAPGSSDSGLGQLLNGEKKSLSEHSERVSLISQDLETLHNSEDEISLCETFNCDVISNASSPTLRAARESLTLSQSLSQHVSLELDHLVRNAENYHYAPRFRLVRELIKGERDYCRALWVVQEKFAKVLRQKHLLPCNDIATLFPDELKSIYSRHCQLYGQLQSRMVTWSPEDKIGDIFANFMLKSDILRLYASYVDDFPEVLNCFRKLCHGSFHFKQFLQETCGSVQNTSPPHSSKLDLGELLLHPVQRLPHLAMILRKLLAHTPIYHPDYAELRSALTALGPFLSRATDALQHSFQLASFEYTNPYSRSPPSRSTSTHLVRKRSASAKIRPGRLTFRHSRGIETLQAPSLDLDKSEQVSLTASLSAPQLFPADEDEESEDGEVEDEFRLEDLPINESQSIANISALTGVNQQDKASKPSDKTKKTFKSSLKNLFLYKKSNK